MDAEVITLSRLLAVRTLQLEMEYVYRSLEDEALDIAAEQILGESKIFVADCICTQLACSAPAQTSTRQHNHTTVTH